MRFSRTSLLPRIATWNAYRRVFSRAGVWTPAIRLILARHGYRSFRLAGTFPGTSVVRRARVPRAGELLVKMFPPLCRDDFPVEEGCLELVRGRITAPRVVARGTLRDRVAWPYLILEPIRGVAIREKLPAMSPPNAQAVARQLGRILRRLHRTPAARLRFLENARGRWPVRRRKLIGEALRQIRRAGALYPVLLRELPARLESFSRPAERPVLVHGDVTEDHLMLVRRGRWRISGLIDFADALAGDPDYELLPVWGGALRRKPELFREFHAAWRPGERITPAWRDRATAFTLLHQFGPPALLELLKQDGMDGRRFAWGSLRDWLWPRELEGKT